MEYSKTLYPCPLNDRAELSLSTDRRVITELEAWLHSFLTINQLKPMPLGALHSLCGCYGEDKFVSLWGIETFIVKPVAWSLHQLSYVAPVNDNRILNVKILTTQDYRKRSWQSTAAGTATRTDDCYIMQWCASQYVCLCVCNSSDC